MSRNFYPFTLSAIVRLASLSLCIVLFNFSESLAQSVGISGTSITPSTNSLLEIRATAASPKGLLIPRMSRADRVAFTGLNAANNNTTERGMLVYQFDTNSGDAAGFYYWTGSAWSRMLDAALSVSLQAAYSGGNTIATSGGNDISISGTEKLSLSRTGANGASYDSPLELARFQTTEASSTNTALVLKGARSTAVRYTSLRMVNEASGEGEYVGAEIAANRKSPGKGADMRFYTRENDVMGERMLVTTLGIGVLGGVPTATNAVVVNGRVKSTGINETSDVRLKKNIQPISGGLSKVLAMEGVTYDWRKEEFPERGLTGELQYGLIAQELEKVIPELVDTDEEGWKSIEYSHIVPVLIEAIKEQQLIIDSQREELTSLSGLSEEVERLKASVELLSEHLRTSQK